MKSSDTRNLAISRSRIVVLALACQACGWNPFAAKEEYVRRGRDFSRQGKYEDAALQYRKAIQKDARYGEAYLRYGQLLAKTNSYAEAFQSLSKAADLMPESEEAKVELGDLAITGLLANPARPPKYYQAATKMSDHAPQCVPVLFQDDYTSQNVSPSDPDRKSERLLFPTKEDSDT